MSQSFSKKVSEFELVTAGTWLSHMLGKRFDYENWYGIHQSYTITSLPVTLWAKLPWTEGFRPRCFPRIAVKYALRKRPELIYTRSWRVAEKCVKAGLPVIVEDHNPARDCEIMSRVLCIVTISEILKETYIEKGLPPDRVLVLSDGVDLNRFSNQQSDRSYVRRSLGLPVDSPIVSYVGRMTADRGIQTILECARDLPDVDFYLFGGFPHHSEHWRECVTKMDLTNAHVFGFVPNDLVPSYLAASDLLLLSYSQNASNVTWTSPLKLFEYMASNRPIIASDITALDPILRHEENALMVEPDSSRAIGAAVVRLLSNPELGERIASQARSDVQAYTWDNRSQKILDYAQKRLGDSQ